MEMVEKDGNCYFLVKNSELKNAFLSSTGDDLYNTLRIIAIGIGIPERNILSNASFMYMYSLPANLMGEFDNIFAIDKQFKSLFVTALKKFKITVKVKKLPSDDV